MKGYVDGFVRGELYGWIVNLNKPERMEPITCRSPTGQALKFHPFTFRADVVQALGILGVFGFTIPLDLLAPLGPVFTVYDRNGTPLTYGTDVIVPPLVDELSSQARAWRASRPLHIFLHIPKTAGTSLRNMLMRALPPGELLLVYGDAPGVSLEEACRLPLAQRDRLSFVFGHHCKFGFDRSVTRPSRYVTFIREPLARLRSNFAHHAAAGNDFMIDGTRLRPSIVLNEGLSEEFDNAMTRTLTGFGRDVVPLGEMGPDEVALALANVRRHFAFIGRCEQADQDTAVLQDYLGLPHDPLSVDNVTPATWRYPAAEIEALDWDRVAARNRADLLLYASLEREGLVSRVLGRAESPIKTASLV